MEAGQSQTSPVDARPVVAVDSVPVDRLGVVASSLCAVHYASVALLPAALGALGLGFLLNPTVEWIFTSVAIVFAAMAFGLGWRRHRSKAVAALLVLGIGALLASRVIEMSAHHEHHGHDSGAKMKHNDHAHAAGDLHDGHAHASGETHGGHAHASGETHGGHAHASSDEPAAMAGHRDTHAHNEASEATHLIGTGVGVAGGIFLLVGHLLNIRAVRRQRHCH